MRALEENGVVITSMSTKQLLKVIDEDARASLGISGKEFMRRFRAGELKHTSVESPIIGLADLVEGR